MNIQQIIRWCNESHASRALLVGILILLLQIPVSSIEQVVHERQATQKQAIVEVQEKWGGPQKLIGPILVVPYKNAENYVENSVENNGQWQYRNDVGERKRVSPKDSYDGLATFLPENLEVKSQLNNQSRYRGIFEVPLFQADIQISGYFNKPSFDDWGIANENILWDKARLVILVSDARAIQTQAKLNLNGSEYSFEPGTGFATIIKPSTRQLFIGKSGYSVALSDFNANSEKFSFSTKLLLNGSESLYVAPLGKDSLIGINAPWPDPSFQGKWLPSSRKVSASGFESQWRIPYLGRNFPQKSLQFSAITTNIQDALVGVDLIFSVDNYRMAERSIKYQLLFLVLTFTAVWLIELLAKLRIHIMQYLFIGAALCVFYLLELSLSEQLGFYIAYLLASLAIVLMISFYSLVILQTGKRAAIIGGSLSTLYLYLFTLLQEQNYSLLIGSLGLFLILALVMYATRNIDWFKVTQLPELTSEKSS